MTLTTLSFIAFLVILPVLLFISIVLLLYRHSMKVWIMYSEGSNVIISDVSIKTALETESDECLVSNVIFVLKGIPNMSELRNFLENLVFERNTEGNLKHEHLQKTLYQTKGFFVWKTCPDFDLDDQIHLAARHHNGRTVTERNIQEYISEICSQVLPLSKPPWRMVIIQGYNNLGSPTTWIVFRIHYLLVSSFALLDFPSSFPNPWDTTSVTNRFPILSAPSAMSEVAASIENAFIIAFRQFILFTRTVFIFICTINRAQINANVVKIYKLRDSLSTKLGQLFEYYNKPLSRKELFCTVKLVVQKSMQFIILIFWFIWNLLSLKWATYAFKNIYSSIYQLVRSEWIQLFIKACVEVFWVIRAIISLPRLLMEEVYATKNSQSVYIWKKKTVRKWNRALVAWSEQVPLGAARDIEGMTGASLSSILLTALTGAIRDLLRSSGSLTPDYLRCTFPIYTPSRVPNNGILPLSLPVGASDGHTALQLMIKSINQLQKYPERYIASIWLAKYASKFIPEKILRNLLIKLTETHPILFTNLVVPMEPLSLWNQTLVGMFYWRPPLQDAVLSVCISSYCGRVSLGVLADGWKVPNASALTKSFVSHLNELAVESGVKLDRQQSRSWSRNRSPHFREVPSTPPMCPLLENLKPNPVPIGSVAFRKKLKYRPK